MSATLRLMRLGKKGHPIYRVVVVDKRKKRNTRYIENIGSYEPMKDSGGLKIDKKKYSYWLSQGALISEGLTRLLKHKKKVTFED
ncbi:30S ribosomal protein S16 [Candidatus Roizmanbacteria bacterium]|nr:30S ribosomal protein S16 [Candidatus Roizmanbacteria bacterium]